MIRSVGSINSSSGYPMLKMWISNPPPAKRPLQRHSHTAFEIMAVIKGGGVYETKRGTIPFGVGDVFVFSSNETHYITEINSTGLEMLNLHFEPRYLWGRSYDSPQNLNFCFAHSPDFPIRIEAQKAEKIRGILEDIKEELSLKNEEYVFAVKGLVSSLLVTLAREHKYLQDGDSDIRKNHSMVKVLEYIDANLSAPLTLEELSKISGNSPTYFSLLFKKTCGITLWDYVTARRIEEAVKILCNNKDLSVLEVAIKVGFNNTANFNKAFKRHTGMTPKQLRNPDIYLH
ncbi:MAG: helix-turn-helix transcriptional regulator [Clostridia bacterium]|nr:helix-turn-helix transcriptional regulator [Clostridia bacterium]